MLKKIIIICILLSYHYAHVAVAIPKQELSLNEAILLAVRENPNVQIAQLNHVLQKYSLAIQKWQFLPHYSLKAQAITKRMYSVTKQGQVTENVSGINPAVSWQTPLGTKMSLTAANNFSDHYNPGLALQITQPLIRGFGRPIVEAELLNAMDSEFISRLNVQNELRNTVTNVINTYLDYISATNTLDVDQQALDRGLLVLDQTKKFIKAGRKAGVEIVTVEAGIANLKTRIEGDKNNIEEARYALLTSIGLDPDTPIHFAPIDIKKLIQKYKLLTLEEAKTLILHNDVPYQVSQITLEGATKRSILIAKDNTRIQLDLTLDGNVGNGSGGGQNAGLNSLVNGVNTNNMATLNLSIPIDDRAAKGAYESSLIALRQAKITLQQEKWGIQTKAINGWKNLVSAERVLSFAEDAVKLQKETYQINLQKYSYGLIDGLSLQTAQLELINAQKNVVDNQINYLKALALLDNLTGNTLKTWKIMVRYS